MVGYETWELLYLNGYAISDSDTAVDPMYFGYINNAGEWYIMKQGIAGGTFRYAKGSSDYTTNWTGRAGLTYQYFNQTFK